VHQFGAPQNSREAFSMLIEHTVLDAELGRRLQRMVGFRNIAVHDYKALNLDIVQAIVEEHLTDFLEFRRLVLQTDGFRST
jgi:uncharacterized protein YutE (UPF0331/DUF86 family)